MKKACLLVLAIVCMAVASRAQDIIILTNGSQLQAKVLEINPGDVKYKDYNNLDGPVITIQKSGVSEIRYANGIKTVLNGSSGGNANSGPGGYKREVYNSSKGSSGFKKRPSRGDKLYGWYFGLGIGFGAANATNADNTYSTAVGNYTGGYLLATKMFNQHMGIQFGLGTETTSYNVSYGYSSVVPLNSYVYNDVYSISTLTIPARFVYFSNSKHRAGLYVLAGFDLSFVGAASDQEGDDLTNYYSGIQFSPYISSGVEFRTRNARAVWMFGPFYKTTITNAYSGESNYTGLLNGNSGNISSVGLSIEYMGKFGRR